VDLVRVYGVVLDALAEAGWDQVCGAAALNGLADQVEAVL